MALTSGSHATSRGHPCIDDGDYIIVVIIILQIETILRLPWRLFLSAKLDSVLSVSAENGLGQNVTHTLRLFILISKLPSEMSSQLLPSTKTKVQESLSMAALAFCVCQVFPDVCGGEII